MLKCQCALQNRLPCQECRELAKWEDAMPYYGDCETNMLDEQIANSNEAYRCGDGCMYDEPDRCGDDAECMFSDDGGYKVDPIEEQIWQASLKLEAERDIFALTDYGECEPDDI
jgi:hypothetical protein